jgi:hypothetical protein
LSQFLQHFFAPTSWKLKLALEERKPMMPKYLVCLIFTAALLGLSANPTVVHAQTNQQATEPDQANQPDEKNESDQAASPENSDQSDQGEDSDAEQPGDESDQPPGSDDSGPQDQD